MTYRNAKKERINKTVVSMEHSPISISFAMIANSYIFANKKGRNFRPFLKFLNQKLEGLLILLLPGLVGPASAGQISAG